MSDYQRFVSYIYGYEQGEKKESAGFVKVNARGNECKIWVHVNENRVPEGHPCQVYVFMRRKDRLQGQFLGELEKRNGAWEWSGVTETDSLMGGSFGLSESGGLYIEGEDRVFAAAWDDLPVSVERFDPEERFARQALEMSGRENEVRAAELALEEGKAEVQETPAGGWETPAESQEPPAESREPREEPREIPVESPPETFPPEDTSALRDSRREQWSYLAKRFPVTRFVEENGAVVCSIRLNNRDLSRIPRDKWELGNNSFLLHGYYQYRHLLLLRRQAEGEVCYYIGVPGVYNEREQTMASMFGFEEFKAVKGVQGGREGFGYWCRTLR